MKVEKLVEIAFFNYRTTCVNQIKTGGNFELVRTTLQSLFLDFFTCLKTKNNLLVRIVSKTGQNKTVLVISTGIAMYFEIKYKF